MYLSYIVLTCATVPTCLALALAWPSKSQLNREPLRCASVVALGYSAAVGYTVALAASNLLAHSSTKILGKHTSSGSIHPLSWLIMMPYHLGLRIKLGLQRLLSTEPLYNRVLPGWYIGGWPWSGAELPCDSPSVLDCTCELPRTHRNRYWCLPVWDTQAPPTSLIERGVAFALMERALGRAVYVHCAHGHGRSALLLIACLLEAGQVDSWEEGLALLKASRPRVHLNLRQRKVLESWAHNRGARCGLQMQALSTLAAAAGGGGAASSSAGIVAVSGVAAGAMALQHRESAGGTPDAGGCGSGEADVGRLHVLADARDGGLQQLSKAVSAPYGGLGSRLSGLAVAAVGGLQGAGGLPRGEALRTSGTHAVAAAVVAASVVEGGKKLS